MEFECKSSHLVKYNRLDAIVEYECICIIYFYRHTLRNIICGRLNAEKCNKRILLNITKTTLFLSLLMHQIQMTGGD